MDTKTASSDVIDRLGGTAAVARMCDIKPPSVSEWRRNGIPKPWLKFLRLARPDVLAEIERAEPSSLEAVAGKGARQGLQGGGDESR